MEETTFYKVMVKDCGNKYLHYMTREEVENYIDVHFLRRRSLVYQNIYCKLYGHHPYTDYMLSLIIDQKFEEFIGRCFSITGAVFLETEYTQLRYIDIYLWDKESEKWIPYGDSGKID